MKTVEDAAASSRRITDNLIFGANFTAASVKDMVEGYKFVGAAASAAGENIESTNALIIALSKAGQMGSEAGVALRSAYVKLLKPTKAGRATMAQLGLDYGNYVAGGKRTGAGVSSGLATYGYEVPARVIDGAMAGAGGNYEKQHRAIYAAVAEHIGAERASDTKALTEAVDGALTLSGGKADLTKLLIDLKKAGAGQGQLANIFEGRQSVRMLSLLKADLPGILKDVNENAAGYSEKTVAKRQQGLEGATRGLSASWQILSNALVRAVTPEIVGMMERLAGSVKNLAASSPATLKLGIGLIAAAVAAGPLMFALGAVGRVGTFALTALLTPIGLAARGIVALGTAFAGLAVAGAARLSAMAIGLRMLSTFGAGAMLSAMGASLLSFGRAVLLFPVTALRAIGVAMLGLAMNPVGLIVGGLVAGLAALGVWVYNNWNGIKQFFAGFGEGFMAGIGGANGPLGTMVEHLQSAYNWLTQLLGPLGESDAKWRSWGETLGGAVASGVRSAIDAIGWLIGKLGSAWDMAKKLGSALTFGYLGGGGSPAPAGGAAPAPIAGARALGGPVWRARPYLVGERGPELFVPGMSGRIETNDTLRRLTADGTAAVAGSTNNTTNRTYSLNPTINIMGGDDPRRIAGQVRAEMERYLRDLEAEQRGLLSD